MGFERILHYDCIRDYKGMALLIMTAAIFGRPQARLIWRCVRAPFDHLLRDV